jgi:aspartyl-tRNA(Asn)/glutamyl-tRNA(Gln) amidotransferase subunit A
MPKKLKVTPDPLLGLGLKGFVAKFRRGDLTSESVLKSYLARIETIDPALNCYECVAMEQALTSARGVDQLIQAGIDLGPLMGVPIAVKGMFAIDGMEVTAGSKLPIADLIGNEGTFIRNLKRAGCVIIGTTKMAELALGGRTGINPVQGTPRNPWDPKRYRVPGASSSGSAVAVSAGLCALSIATDTGGSARLPAALCGAFGLKTTAGLWPTDGMLPSVPMLDTIGLIARSAEDTAWAFVSGVSTRETDWAG